MPLPFPGMDPYLEHPDRWPSVHSRLIVELADFLTPQLLPKYFVDIEERIYLTAGEERAVVVPDVTVKRDRFNPNAGTNVAVAKSPSDVASLTATEPVAVTVPMLEEVKRNYLEIKEAGSKEVVTAIEILSPTNKRPGKGREKYDRKRQQIFNSRTHLVEIDLSSRAKLIRHRTGKMPVLRGNFYVNIFAYLLIKKLGTHATFRLQPQKRLSNPSQSARTAIASGSVWF